jgi:SAM-dependent methyltransferase/uncharacterized protein YbaR (Trm112 family)
MEILSYGNVRCPRCRTQLHQVSNHLISCRFRHSFPIVDGKPILIQKPSEVSLTSPANSITSQNIDLFSLPEGLVFGPNSKILHLGSGNVPSSDPRVISVDIVPANNVDIVCLAENLPFQSGTFDLVTSGAVLEHVYNPIASAREIQRVLKVGGISLHTVAFMQPYHGFPSHYFNWTPIAMESYLLQNMEFMESRVAENGTLGQTLTQSWNLYLEKLTISERERLLNLKMSEALELMVSDYSNGSVLEGKVSRFTRDQLSAAYTIQGKKLCYSRISLQDNRDFDFWQERRVVYLRIQEVAFYRAKCDELTGSNLDFLESNLFTNEHENVVDEITKSRHKDLEGSIQKLNKLTAELTDLRDSWITQMLAIDK